jgi:hypothetical protein
VIQTPVADGRVRLQHRRQRFFPGVAGTGNAFASFLLGQVQTFAIDLQQTDVQERAHFQEYFIQDDWKVSGSPHDQRRAEIHAQFPVDRRSTVKPPVFNLQTRQLEYPGHGARTAAREGQLRPAPLARSTA